MRPVHVAQISDGQALIDQGLKSGDVVVVDGQYRLAEGSRVQSCTARPRAKPTCRAPCRTRSHEPLRALHPAADRNRPADGGPAAVRPRGLSAAAGRRAAERQLPDHPDLGATARRRPRTIASSVATPLEQQLSQIPGVTQLTSSSALGVAQLTVQFELSRTVDSAAVDVLAAINAASPYLPPNIPYPPTIRKVNPAETPIMLIALTSDSLPLTTVDAYAENILLPKISQVPGVGLVGIGGQQKPAIRVRVNPQALAARGIGLEDVRNVIAGANVDLPKGTLNSPRVTYTLNTNDQLLKPSAYEAPHHRLSQRLAGADPRHRHGGRGPGERPAGRLVRQAAAPSSWRSSACPAPTSSRPSTASRSCCRSCRPPFPPAIKVDDRRRPHRRPSAPRSPTCSSRCC